MHTIYGEPNEVYPAAIQAVMKEGAIVPSRVSSTREIHPMIMEVVNPRKRLVTAIGRPINVPFALAEVLWILGGRSDVAMLSHYNSKIHEYSDDGVSFNAAYGERLWRTHGRNQLSDTIQLLEKDPESRQAVMVMWHPGRDNPDRTTKDRACNFAAHVMIRDGALDWLQVVRSNDAMWGTPYNFMQWTHVQEYIASAVGVPVGKLFWVADSFHIYDYHWEEADNVVGFDLYKELGAAHALMGDTSHLTITILLQLEQQIRTLPLDEIHSGLWGHIQHVKVGDYWKAVLGVLLAYRLYKEKQDYTCLSFLRSEVWPLDPVYAVACMRFFYRNRWHKTGFDYKNVRDSIEFWHTNKVADWIMNG